MHIKDIFTLFSVLSKFHYDFINNRQQLKLINTCIEYDFGSLQKLSIKISYNEKDMAVSKQLESMYTNYDFWIDLFDKMDLGKVVGFNYGKFIQFGNQQLLKYWITQV